MKKISHLHCYAVLSALNLVLAAVTLLGDPGPMLHAASNFGEAVMYFLIARLAQRAAGA